MARMAGIPQDPRLLGAVQELPGRADVERARRSRRLARYSGSPGPPGMVGLRHPQFRYTHPFNPHHWVGGSVEKSGTDIRFSTLFGTPVPTSTRPDLVVFYRYENQYGHLYAA